MIMLVGYFSTVKIKLRSEVLEFKMQRDNIELFYK